MTMWAVCVVTGLLFLTGYTQAATLIGNFTINTCREDTILMNWTLPSTFEPDFVSIEFRGLPNPDVPNPKEILIISWDRHTDDWKITNNPKRYLSRLSALPFMQSSFELQNTRKLDTGSYEYNARKDSDLYVGRCDLMVYHEDNLWPNAIGNSSNVPNSDGGETTYTYSFTRPFSCPATGIKMFATDGNQKSKNMMCSFSNETEKCEITFADGDFGGLSGTLTLEVDPIFKPGTPECDHIIKPFYNLMITIVPPDGLTKGQTGGLVVAVVIIVAVSCIVPLAVSFHHRRRKQFYKHVPLLKGLKFVEFCTCIIQASEDPEEDFRGIYRANKPESQTKHFITVYMKAKDINTTNNPGKEYIEERPLMAAAIKMFLKEEETPWLPMELQRDISSRDKDYMTNGQFDVEQIQKILLKIDSKEGQARYDILSHLMHHFLWLSDVKKTLHENSQVVGLDGLVTCTSPNLFKEVIDENTKILEATDMEPLERAQESGRQNEKRKAFVGRLIQHAQEVFIQRLNVTLPSRDMTHQKLLAEENGERDELNNIV